MGHPIGELQRPEKEQQGDAIGNDLLLKKLIGLLKTRLIPSQSAEDGKLLPEDALEAL
jgi:hypothetical protein